MKFKIGDKVRRQKNFAPHWPLGIDVVTVETVSVNGHLTFVGVKNTWDECNFTIGESAPPPDQKLTPQVGEIWRMRNGEVTEPLKVHERSGMLYTGEWVGNRHCTWWATGAHTLNEENPFDLISRVETCPTFGSVK